MTMRVLGYLSLAAAVLLAASMAIPQAANNKEGLEWAAYGGNPEDTHYSPLKQINRSNVGKLQVAWTYDCSDGRGGLETNPLVVNGLVYGNTPGGKLFALDGATGRLVWSWDSKSSGQPTRGFAYWADGADRRTHWTFSDGWPEEIGGGFRFGQLAKFEAAREDESATRAGKARWKVFGPSRCVAMHNSGARPRI